MWGYKITRRYKIECEDTMLNVRIQNNARIQCLMWGYKITPGYKIECEDTRSYVGIKNGMWG